MNANVSSRFGRIVVAVDVSSPDTSAFEIAAKFAEAENSELVGLFVEDEDLVNLAALPFAREVTFNSITCQTFDVKDLERQLTRAAGRARNTLAKIASSRNLRWRFEIVRGQIQLELKSAAKNCDLLVLTDRSEAFDDKLADFGVRTVFQDVPCSATLVVGASTQISSGAIVAILDPRDTSEEMLTRVVNIAKGHHLPLMIILLTDEEDSINQVQSMIDQQEMPDLKILLDTMSSYDIREVSNIVKSISASLILLEATSEELMEQKRVFALSKFTATPVLVLRP